MQKIKVCEFCKAIYRGDARTKYCSKSCKHIAAYLRSERGKAYIEGCVHFKAYIAHIDNGDSRNCCPQCLRQWWASNQEEFCSEGCRTLYYGGNTRKVRDQNDYD